MANNNMEMPLLDPLMGKVTAAEWIPSTPTNVPKASNLCIQRIMKDIKSFYNDPPPGIFILPDESDMTVIHAMIVGPSRTPYEGGFFYFLVRCPPDYPIKPPKVTLMTTGQNRVRFNPNLYSSGKVCLSILGTWTGPHWTAAQCLSSMLLSIQSLLGDKPYYNEPGAPRDKHEESSEKYNVVIRHETIRVAVCDMLEKSTSDSRNIPAPFHTLMRDIFPQYYEGYLASCEQHKSMNGKKIDDPYHENRGDFCFATLKNRLKSLKESLDSSSSTLQEAAAGPSHNNQQLSQEPVAAASSAASEDSSSQQRVSSSSNGRYYEYPQLVKAYPWLKSIGEEETVPGVMSKDVTKEEDVLQLWEIMDDGDDDDEEGEEEDGVGGDSSGSEIMDVD